VITAVHERHPRKRADQQALGIKDSHKIDVYLQHDGYQALRSPEGDEPERSSKK